MRGASALDSLLAEFPEADLRVQVDWEPVLLSDIAAPLSTVLGLIRDQRVTQYWDPDRVVSAEFVRSVNANPARYGFDDPLPPEYIAWDNVAVFQRSARWGHDSPVPAFTSGPVIDAIAATRVAIATELAAARTVLE